jgi:hypothetical protein
MRLLSQTKNDLRQAAKQQRMVSKLLLDGAAAITVAFLDKVGPIASQRSSFQFDRDCSRWMAIRRPVRRILIRLSLNKTVVRAN